MTETTPSPQVLIVADRENQSRFLFLEHLLKEGGIVIVRSKIGERLSLTKVNPKGLLVVDSLVFLRAGAQAYREEIDELMSHYDLGLHEVSFFDLWTQSDPSKVLPVGVKVFGIGQDEAVFQEMMDAIELRHRTEDQLSKMCFQRENYQLENPASKQRFYRDLIHLREREQSVVTVQGGDLVKTIWWTEREDYERRRGEI